MDNAMLPGDDLIPAKSAGTVSAPKMARPIDVVQGVAHGFCYSVLLNCLF
jgi:hypothetical protein